MYIKRKQIVHTHIFCSIFQTQSANVSSLFIPSMHTQEYNFMFTWDSFVGNDQTARDSLMDAIFEKESDWEIVKFDSLTVFPDGLSHEMILKCERRVKYFAQAYCVLCFKSFFDTV